MATYKDYMLFDKLPHTWCAGCGHGIVLQSIAACLAEQGWDKHDIALVSGIGCFGRVADYLYARYPRPCIGRSDRCCAWQS